MVDRHSRIKDPFWYKDAIIYEVRIRSFYDSNADGIGDLPGITEKLDYLQGLGVNTLWLLPFYPSPLRDDGYDIANYYDIHPQYGTLNDFKHFLSQAHERGLNIITELVLNHTSDQHAWFQRARRAKKNSSWRNFYVWSDTPTKYKEARIIFKDFERSNWTWDAEANAFYWHRFYSHQPDLNYDHPAVQKAMFEVVDFWFEMGVDGMRLDTIPYLFEREGTSCENLPETHEFVKVLRRHIDSKFDNRMLLAEANQWPSDSVAYFGKGDECHMAFHFPIMPRLFMSIQLEDRFPLIDILQQTPPIPDNAQWGLFLRNHDELTLEMVTDEERDYMYRAYAQESQARLNLGIRRRLAPLLGNDRRKIELMNGILFSFPGTPFIYYGDEIGMGDNIFLGDRDGVRTPMQWSPDRNAGFSKANSQKLCLPITMDPEYSYETVNVETQQKNPFSLLWWMRRLIGLRKRFKAFGRGTIEFLDPLNTKVLAFIRRYQDECILIVANFSRLVEYVELNLSQFKDWVPYEIFGRNRFPPIGELSYLLTLGPYAFYWFSLKSVRTTEKVLRLPLPELPTIEVPDQWREVFQQSLQPFLERCVLLYLLKTPWFKGKDFPFKKATIQERISLPFDNSYAYLLLVRTDYDKGNFDLCVVPVAYIPEKENRFIEDHADAHIAKIQVKQGQEVTNSGILYDSFCRPEFLSALFNFFIKRKQFHGIEGRLINTHNPIFKTVYQSSSDPLTPILNYFERSVINIKYGNQWFLKIYRYLNKGINPEIEIGDFLTTKTNLQCIPATVGTIDYLIKGEGEPFNIGLWQTYIVNEGTAWKYTLDELDRYYERLMTKEPVLDKAVKGFNDIFDWMNDPFSEDIQQLIGSYSDSVQIMGQRTGEMHLALASSQDNPNFIPETSNIFYQRSLYQSKRSLTSYICAQLRHTISNFPKELQILAQQVIQLENEIIQVFESFLNLHSTSLRIRCHGDYHLSQLLFTGKDFVIIDFEQNENLSFEERRRKKSPLRDIAGIFRSFHFAAFKSLLNQSHKGLMTSETIPHYEKWAVFWQTWASSAFLKAYLETVAQAPFIPQDGKALKELLKAFLLEKALDDLIYELNHPRFDWLDISLKWILLIQQG